MQKLIMKLTKIFGIVLSLHVGVILLVMFQPSCQTVEKKKEPGTEVEKPPLDTTVNEFNQGSTNTGQTGQEVFVAPTRPSPGEIIIPGNELVIPQPTESGLLVPPSNEPDSSPLRPTDLSIYKVVRGDTLWGIARKNSISLSLLLGSNPNLSKSSKLSIGQEIMIPSGSSTAAPNQNLFPQPDSGNSSSTYLVVAGDSLSRIARNNNVSLSALMQINGMNSSSIIRPGQTLLLPDASSSTGNDATPTVVPPGATTHIVKKGENLTRISKIYGVSIKQIMALNGLSDAGKISVGQSLVVSGTDQASMPESPAPVTSPGTITEADDEGESKSDSLQNFFKGTTEDRPLIDAPDNP